MARSRRTARGVALAALDRIDDGAYANLVLPPLLAASGLAARDRHLATELAYGTTRMRRACDWLVDRYVLSPPDTRVRNLLRLGAYQLAFMRVPAHAAVSATVAEAPGKVRGFVNAILRKVAAEAAGNDGRWEWPDEATRLSYPDWIVDRLVADLGREDALAALEQMNEAPDVTERPDGYVQDEASQAVAAYVGVQPGERVADVCAAPGGKATLMAHAGAAVVMAADVAPHRAGLVAANAERVGTGNVATVVADSRRPPARPRSFDRVLLDAPCSGLGVLRRRPDARWRITPANLDELTALQRDLLDAAAALVRPGGVLVYSVCTLTDAETRGVVEPFLARRDDATVLAPPGAPWRPAGHGALLLPQAAGTDGMYVIGVRLGDR